MKHKRWGKCFAPSRWVSSYHYLPTASSLRSIIVKSYGTDSQIPHRHNNSGRLSSKACRSTLLELSPEIGRNVTVFSTRFIREPYWARCVHPH